jgi:hypothetical protein
MFFGYHRIYECFIISAIISALLIYAFFFNIKVSASKSQNDKKILKF